MTKSPAAKVTDDAPFASIRLAQTPDEVREAQKLRYKVFYEEYGAIPNPLMSQEKRDFDDFDDIADHLIVINTENGKTQIVGTYRLLRQDVAEKHAGFYSSSEYDLTPLLKTGSSLLELGRSCVLAEFRTKPILNLLWQGIADYVSDHEVEFLLGCACFPGTDVSALEEQLSYLHHFHRASDDIRPVALKERYVNMNIIPKEDIDERKVFNSLPPLIKGYLRAGAMIGDGAVIDSQFNTTDVCIVAQTKFIADRYRKYYERKIQKNITSSDENLDDTADNRTE
jgi:putative hemolysin